MQCLDGGAAPECGYSCDAIKERWYWLADTEGGGGSGYCEAAEDCSVLSGRCDIGLGPCWFAFAGSQDLNESQIHEMADAWQALGCGTSIECDCGPPPQPQCLGFSCGLQTSPLVLEEPAATWVTGHEESREPPALSSSRSTSPRAATSIALRSSASAKASPSRYPHATTAAGYSARPLWMMPSALAPHLTDPTVSRYRVEPLDLGGSSGRWDQINAVLK